MKEITIKSFAEFHKMIENYNERTVIYRGMKSAQFPLIPKIGRIVPPSSFRSRKANEQEILRLFKERALPYLDFIPTIDWDWLAIGQQYGLPTRLLDWTANPLVACFFAVGEESKEDSVIYAYHDKTYISVDKHPNPFKYNKIGKFIPRHLTPRITSQGGVFTIHPEPYQPFEADNMEKLSFLMEFAPV